MSRELWLLRHAKAKRDERFEDFDRPLKKSGKLAALELGEWLQQQNLIPDWVLSSPAKRAIGTATRVVEALNGHDLTIMQDKRIYAEGYQQLKSVLAECPVKAQRVLLVGHNPELEDLLICLVGAVNVPERDKILRTTALARLAMPDDWTQLGSESAQLLSIVDPDSLRA